MIGSRPCSAVAERGTSADTAFASSTTARTKVAVACETKPGESWSHRDTAVGTPASPSIRFS